MERGQEVEVSSKANREDNSLAADMAVFCWN
jgi:hypothetical protein